jgi:hypothetical protein
MSKLAWGCIKMIFFIIDTVPFSKIRKTGKFSTKTKRKVEK